MFCKYFIKHNYCEKCISSWLTKNNSCPMCRHKIDINKYGLQTWDLLDYDKQDLVTQANITFYDLFYEYFIKVKET